MRIMFLGTGAADWPTKRPDGATEYRRLSSALVDGVLLIDPNQQVLEALSEFGRNAADIKYVINTHRHFDHYCDDTLSALEELGARFFSLNAGDTAEAGPYTVIAYPANHGTATETVHFTVTDGKKTLFYGLDGAWLLYDEVQAIKSLKPNLAVLDATIGDIEGDYRIFEHNNLVMILEMQKTLAPYVGHFCISHMARTLHTDQKTLERRMKPYGVTVAYDGLEIEL